MRVALVSASLHNVFFTELFEALEDMLVSRGADVHRAVDHFPAPAHDLVTMFVPHEYMPLVEVESRPTAQQLRRTVAICTEQPGTKWFSLASETASSCGSVLDISGVGIRALRADGVDASLLPLGYVPRWDHWHRDETAPRDIDMAFLGGYTNRRGRVLARCGGTMQAYETALHLSETIVPHGAQSRNFVSGEKKWDLLSRSHVLLNVHRGEVPYMEWLRAVQAIVNGAVLVTEQCTDFGPLEAGVHFFSGGYDRLRYLLPAVLSDRDRLARVRADAYGLLNEQRPASAAADALMEAAERAGKRTAVRRGGDAPPRPRPVRLERRHEIGGSAHRLEDMALKHLVLETQAIRRELARLADPGPPPPDGEELFGGWEGRSPRVSVVITVYNYADYVGGCLRTVAASDHDAFEVVVVDDCSTDDSREIVRAELAEHPSLAAKLVCRERNQGLAAARNCGVAHARGELIFMLDADNGVYPRALRRLEAALEADRSLGFAYAIIEGFECGGPVGLLSWLPWDVERLRYGNFVDAMAMIRRSALLEVGGYDGSSAIFGWEDFALWCALAGAGHHGVLVPQILSRYRVSPYSMISLTNIDDSSAWSTMLRRYPVLRPGPLEIDPRVDVNASR